MIDRILQDGFGMITCGDHLGVFVSPLRQVGRTPPGWVFVPSETMTAEILQEAIDCAKSGRSDWPKAEKQPKAKITNRRKKAAHIRRL
jgi:hypothetical protein